MGAAPHKQHAHELIERLPPSEVATASRFLEFILLDPVARAVATAPDDQELVTEQDRRRLHEGQAWFRQQGGKGIPMADVLAEFNLTNRKIFPTRPMTRSKCRLFEGILHFARTGVGDVRVLHGDMAGSSRLRVGDYRVLFTLEQNTMRIFGVRHRSEAYR